MSSLTCLFAIALATAGIRDPSLDQLVSMDTGSKAGMTSVGNIFLASSKIFKRGLVSCSIRYNSIKLHKLVKNSTEPNYTFLIASTALLPPNPKEFEIALCTVALRAVWGM